MAYDRSCNGRLTTAVTAGLLRFKPDKKGRIIPESDIEANASSYRNIPAAAICTAAGGIQETAMEVSKIPVNDKTGEITDVAFTALTTMFFESLDELADNAVTQTS